MITEDNEFIKYEDEHATAIDKAISKGKATHLITKHDDIKLDRYNKIF